MLEPRPTSRRRFLKTAGATAATFTILQAGSARTYAANEKLNIASIGAGGRASGDIQGVASQNIVALGGCRLESCRRNVQTFPGRQAIQRLPRDAGGAGPADRCRDSWHS